MATIVSSLLSALLLYKYFALFFIVFAIAVIVPLPTNVILLATGAFASLGYFNFSLSLLASVAGAVAGDVFDYALARRYGPRVLGWLHADRHYYFERLRHDVRENARMTIFVTRFVGPLDQIVSLFSGSIGVAFDTFLIYDFLGNLASTFMVLYVGYLAGSYWQDFSGVVDTVGSVLLVAILLFAVVRIFLRHRHPETADKKMRL